MGDKEKLQLDEDVIDDTDRSSGKVLDSLFLLNIINDNRVPIAFLLIGLLLIGIGVFYLKFQDASQSEEIVVLEENAENVSEEETIFVEIAGAVEKPGVYEFKNGDRVEDLLSISGGLSGEADNEWVEKFVNRAALLSDGQKLYIPKTDEQMEGSTANSDVLYQNDTTVLGVEGSTIVNINTATQSELEELWGIGPVYAQKIIEQRPYSSVEELLEKGVVKSNVYEKNKDILTVY